MKKFSLLMLLFPLLAGALGAQRWRGGMPGGDDYYPEFETCRTAREVPWHSTAPPNWTNEAGFEKDVFAFARIRRDRRPYGSWRAGFWWTDFPDSDLNLSFRLQQMTSLKVDPDGRVLDLTAPAL